MGAAGERPDLELRDTDEPDGTKRAQHRQRHHYQVALTLAAWCSS